MGVTSRAPAEPNRGTPATSEQPPTQVTFISVVIPTANRPIDIERCLNSLLRVGYSRWELIVVDQSDDDATAQAVGRISGRMARCRYIRLRQKGAARARNAALQVAEGELIAFVDDDCTVEPTWLQTIADVFASHPDVSLVFGRVLSSESASPDSFTPVYEFANPRQLRGSLAMLHTGCMAASMYMRPNLWHSVGPVDVCTGAGAPFACEDRDYCYRVLKDGHVVLETPEISVFHHGGRPYFGGAASRLIRRDAYSFGALHMKALRCGDPAAIVLIAAELWRNLGRIKLMRVLRGDRPTGLAWMPMYLSGLVAGLRRPIDRRRRLWRCPDAPTLR